MKSKPNLRRRYNSESRRANALETTRRILDVAKALFGKRGIDRVTIDEMSAAAGVSSPTVYALFRSKAGILKALIEGAFFGESYVVLAERTNTTNDPIELLHITASISRVIFDTEREEIGL